MQPTAHTETVKIAGTEVSFETGRIARQAHGAVLARCGDNVVLATVTAAATPKPGQDFFPLTVEYREKFAGAGRIPGAFGKREGRITDHEVLVCRLIDRSVRSLFPEHYKNDVQIQVQVLSSEPTSDLESLAIMAACCALRISHVPANGPVAGLRIWRIDGEWHAFVGREKAADADLEFSVAVGPDGLVMLEGEAREVAEADAIAAIGQATEWIKRCHSAFDSLATKVGRTREHAPAAPELPTLPDATREALGSALQITEKADRRVAIAAAKEEWLATLEDDARAPSAQAYGDAVWEQMRENVLATGKRLDGRSSTDVRAIWSEVGLLPRAHGSALFTRGETQAIVTCTLGSPDDALRAGNLADDGERQPFFLHYNFPPYSVGEIRPLRGPGRREIGHGSLARRGLQSLVPDRDRFNPKVREAISHAINRQAIIDGAMFGYGTPIGTHFAPHNPDYVDLTGMSQYDPELSKKLLEEAGFPDGFETTLKLPPPSYARRGGEIIASQLRAIGIETEITNLEWAQWLEQVFKGKDYGLTIVSHTEPMDIGIYARPDYYFQYDNPEFQALFADITSENDPEKRSALLKQAQEKIAADHVNGYLFQLAFPTVADARIKGLWKNQPTQATDLTGVSWEN